MKLPTRTLTPGHRQTVAAAAPQEEVLQLRAGALRRLRTALDGADVPYLAVDRKNAATFDPQSPEVKIMTVHASKGYEFDVVILFGLEALPSPADGDK